MLLVVLRLLNIRQMMVSCCQMLTGKLLTSVKASLPVIQQMHPATLLIGRISSRTSMSKYKKILT